jgi:CelD/BcsL family acetyltransferase involved in cellulose biosynthesis
MPTAIEHRRNGVSTSTIEVSSSRGGFEIVDHLADEWRDLCAQAVDDQPFYRPEWIRAHIRTFTPGARVRLVTARIDRSLLLVLPLLEEKSTFNKIPVRKLRAPVNCHGGRFDAVIRSGPEGDAALRATWEYLKELGDCDLLQFPDTPAGSTVGRLAEIARTDGFRVLSVADRPNPYIPVPQDPELLSKMPANSKLRSQLRQARNRLAQQGELKFDRVQTADRKALDRFYQLEVRGWKGQAGTAILRNGSLAFYEEMARASAHFGYFSLFMLEWKGELLAGHFGFTYGDKCYSPIVTYNEKFRQYAPGHLIIGEILRDCALRGISEYDITGQDQPWKMKWTSQAHGVNHHFVFKGARGRLAHTVGCRIRPAISSVLRRKTELSSPTNQA